MRMNLLSLSVLKEDWTCSLADPSSVPLSSRHTSPNVCFITRQSTSRKRRNVENITTFSPGHLVLMWRIILITARIRDDCLSSSGSVAEMRFNHSALDLKELSSVCICDRRTTKSSASSASSTSTSAGISGGVSTCSKLCAAWSCATTAKPKALLGSAWSTPPLCAAFLARSYFCVASRTFWASVAVRPQWHPS
jgi:hypothetical protein